MKQVLLAHPVVAEIVAVVGGEHDQRFVEEAAILHEAEQQPELIVDLLDEPHVDGDDLLAHLFARKRRADTALHELGEKRMRVAALLLGSETGSTSLAPYMAL